jgi:DNA-3-methyladenine glycosylase II
MKFTLTPVLPFDFDLTAGFFSYDDAQIRKYESGEFSQVIRLSDKLALITITSTGNIDKPKLNIELNSNKELNNFDKQQAKKIIRNIFNLDLDLNVFYQAIYMDKILSKVVKKLRGLKGPNNATIFEGLVCSIIEQQISLNVAFSVQKKVTKKFGDKLKIGKYTYYSFPQPKDFLEAQLKDLRICGLSTRKAEYIKGVAELIVDNKLNLEKYKNYPEPEEVINELSKIRGIGVWTVELTMIRSMNRFDVIPADDLGLKRYVAHHYYNDKKITSQDIRDLATQWGPWKGLVAYYLLEADRIGLELKNEPGV